MLRSLAYEPDVGCYADKRVSGLSHLARVQPTR